MVIDPTIITAIVGGVVTIMVTVISLTLGKKLSKSAADVKTHLQEIQVNVDGRLDKALQQNSETTDKLIQAVTIINEFKNLVDALNAKLERVTGDTAPPREVQSIVPDAVAPGMDQPMTHTELVDGAAHLNKETP